jgi:hypothetical protein
LAGLSLVSLIPLAVPSILSAAVLAAVFAFLPGWLLAPRIAPGWTRAGRILVALVLSPFLAGGIGAVMIVLGVHPPLAARLVSIVLASTAFASAVRSPSRSRSESVSASVSSRAGEGAIFVAAVGWTALVALLLLVNRDLIPRSDGWFHAAVTEQIALRGLPPEDPFFAGLRLLYFWGTHAWAALWLALQPRLSVWAPWIVLNLSGSLATILGVALLARRLGANTGGTVAGAALAVLGHAPFAWGWIAARAASGSVRGWPEVERLVREGIGPTLGSMGTGMLHLSMVFSGGKFLVMTPFAIGLGVFLAFVLAVLDFAGRPGPREGILLALLIACSLFLHTFVGLCCLALTAGYWGWLLLGAMRARAKGRDAGDEDAARRSLLLRLPPAAAAGVLFVSPYLASILLGKQGQLASGFSRAAVITWLWGGALIVPAGTAWLWRRREGGAARLLLAFAILLTIAGLGIDPSDNNQSKFFNLLFLLLAAPAGLGWVELWGRLRAFRRAVLAFLLGAAVLPTVLLSLWAYACEPGMRSDPKTMTTPPERRAFAWAREHSPVDAVIVEEGGGRNAAVLAARSVLWGGDAWAKKWGYRPEALRIRERAARELESGGEFSPEVAAFLALLRRPIVLVRKEGEGAGGRSEGGESKAVSWAGNPIHEEGGVKLLLITPNE